MTIGTAGIAGREFDHLNWPEDVVVDTEGRISVIDGGNQRVQVFDSTGAYLTTIGGASGTNSSQFYNASSVAIDSAGNVYVSDNINSRIQKYAPGVPDWKQVNINGFGSPNTILPVLKPFNGQLYAGAGYWCEGAQILRTADGITWDPVTTPGEGISVGNVVILSMIEFGGKLYVGTGWNCGGNPPEIWRTTDGTVWTQVMTGTLDAEWNIDAFGVFGDQIYTAISTINGVTIYRSSTGDVGSWAPVVTGGNGDVDNDLIRDFAVFNDRLYTVGGNTANGAFVWQSTADGSTWTQANTPGFDSTIQSDAQSTAVFNGTLYVGTICQSPVCVGDHSEIWKATNGTDWSLVPTPFANNSYWDVTSLYAFKDALFAVVARPGGNTVWKTFNGTGWQQVNINGWGDSNNEWSLWDNAITAFNNRIYVATNNVANGAEIWRYSFPLYLPLITR